MFAFTQQSLIEEEKRMTNHIDPAWVAAVARTDACSAEHPCGNPHHNHVGYATHLPEGEPTRECESCLQTKPTSAFSLTEELDEGKLVLCDACYDEVYANAPHYPEETRSFIYPAHCPWCWGAHGGGRCSVARTLLFAPTFCSSCGHVCAFRVCAACIESNLALSNARGALEAGMVTETWHMELIASRLRWFARREMGI